MHNIFFRNKTSHNKRRRILSTSELTEKEGIYSRVNRHLVCRIAEVKDTKEVLSRPILHVFKLQDKKQRTEIFYCKVKGCMYFALKDRLCIVTFINSLRIQLRSSDSLN